MSVLFRFEDVTLGYGRHRVAEHLSFEISAGDFLGLVGPNGAGKTTILRALLGMISPIEGRLERPGQEVAIGYVPQRRLLDTVFPLSVEDVVLMGLYPRIGLVRRPRAEHRAAVSSALERVAIAPLAARPYRDLSGGQQQRCLIARALVAEPSLLILDEPTNDLDLGGEAEILDLLASIWRERGVTIVLVTHLLNIVANYVDRLAILHEGRLTIGSTEAMLTGETLSRTYGRRVIVETVDGRRAVLYHTPPDR
ncbi:MAG: metal ABC transporter ATP-binding protein [Planctomycetota bacterium]